MTGIFIFDNALRSSWVKHLCTNVNKRWKTVWEPGLNIDTMLNTGGFIDPKMINKVENPYWKEVLSSWNDYLDKLETPKDPTTLCNEPLCKNNKKRSGEWKVCYVYAYKSVDGIPKTPI